MIVPSGPGIDYHQTMNQPPPRDADAALSLEAHAAFEREIHILMYGNEKQPSDKPISPEEPAISPAPSAVTKDLILRIARFSFKSSHPRSRMR